MNPRKSEIAVFADWLQGFETTLMEIVQVLYRWQI
jgi:hypothetical protein